MSTIIYSGHLVLATVEDLRNYLQLINRNVKFHPAQHHKINNIKGSLNQIDIDRALQEAGLHYNFDGNNYHILKR